MEGIMTTYTISYNQTSTYWTLDDDTNTWVSTSETRQRNL